LPGRFLPETPVPKFTCLRAQLLWFDISKAESPLFLRCLATSKVGDLLPAWTARFTPASDGVASPFTLLAVYELLALLFGLGGLVWAVLRGHRFGIALGVWAGAGILLLLLMPGKTGLDTLWGLLPLALLTGIAIEQLAQGLGERGDWLSEGLHIPVVILLWIRLYLALASYAVSGNSADLALVLLVFALQALLSVVFALGLSFGGALRSAAVGTGVVLLAMMISAGWGVAYVRPSDPREPLVSDPTAVEVRDLVGTLRDLSWQRTGLPQTLEFTLEAAPDSVLAWYLRGFVAHHRIESLGVRGGEEIADVLVTTRLDPVGLSAEYVGQSFTLHRSWDSATIACISDWPPQCHSAVGWWLFRDSSAVPVPAVDQQAVLWVQTQAGLSKDAGLSE